MRLRKLLVAIALSLASMRVAAQGGTIGGGGGGGAAAAGTLTGTTLATNVVTSSLTSLGAVTVRAANGTEALPTLSFANSSGTGLYRFGADTLGFTAAGAAVMRLSSDGLIPAANVTQTLGSGGFLWSVGYIGQLSGTQFITGNNAGSMIITAGSGNSRTLTLRTTTSAGTTKNTLVLGADTTATFLGQPVMPGLPAEGSTKNAMCWDGSTFAVTQNAAATCTVSARRFKENIKSLQLSDAKRIVMLLNPVSYAEKATHIKHFGLVAEEADSADSRLGSEDAKGRASSVNYEQVTVLLLKVVQDQQRQLDALGGVRSDSTIGPLKKHINVNNAVAILGLIGAVGGTAGAVAARRRPSLRIDLRA